MIAPLDRECILDSLRAGFTLEASARAVGVTLAEAQAEAGLDAAWATAVHAALTEGLRPKAPVRQERREVAAGVTPSVTGGAPASLLAPDDAARWAAVRAHAAQLAPGPFGTLLWLDARCKAAGMYPMDEWWLRTIDGFYASGKPEHAGRVGLRGAKSGTIPRPLTNDALFTERTLDPTTPGVIPIISVDKTEADGRFATIRGVLRACGMAPKKPDDSDVPILPDGLPGIYESATMPSGGGVIYVSDSQGHGIEFRVYAAKVAGVVGYTGVGGFCDEVDLWIDDRGVNPAERVLDLLSKRYTTQPDARLYAFSASYYADSAHKRKIDEGDTMQQHLARLGELGAARDGEARRRLAALIRSDDPRLLAPADPSSPDIPAWVCNPLVTIETCYGKSKERLGAMLALYGGRAHEAVGKGGGGVWTVEDWAAHRAMMDADRGRLGETDFPPLYFDDFGTQIAAPGPYRGL